MPEIFPPTIAQCFALANFIQQNEPNVIRSDVDVGKAKIRRRYTLAVVNVNGSIIVDKIQVNTFYEFYNITLQGGAKSFLFMDPVSDTEKEYRFVDPPVIENLAGKADMFTINMALEIIP